ncbi:retroviral-like aspartic protease [Pelagibaca abyssi]|nr:retroviral-like aspartic protease [Salipiger abyssi]
MTNDAPADEIRFLTADGRILASPSSVKDCPVIEYALPHSLGSSGEFTNLDWSNAPFCRGWALVDTGADHNYIDTALAEKLGVVPTQTVQVSGATSTTAGKIIDAPLFLIGSRTICDNEFITADLRDNGRMYDVVIGRTILYQRTLLMCPTSDRYLISRAPL